MDIFNRPPSIAEDTVHYALYPPPQSSDKLSVTSLVPCIHEYVDELLHGFIWHRDAFEVKIAEDPNTNSWFLEGQMRVGDCIDDEWYTVWLLREISSKWDLVIRYDSTSRLLFKTLIIIVHTVFMIQTESFCSSRPHKHFLHGSNHLMPKIGCALFSIQLVRKFKHLLASCWRTGLDLSFASPSHPYLTCFSTLQKTTPQKICEQRRRIRWWWLPRKRRRIYTCGRCTKCGKG